jgi:hypothetical protein
MSDSDLDLVFEGRAYAVPKTSVFDLVTHQRDLQDAKSYAIRSSVPASVFQAFVGSLKSQTKPTVTQENAASLSLLAKELFLRELGSECAAFGVDPLSLLSARVAKLERQISYLGKGKVEEVGSEERGLQAVRQELEGLKGTLESVARKQSRMEGLIRTIETSQETVKQGLDSLKTVLVSLEGKQSRTEIFVRNIETIQRSLRQEIEALKANGESAAPGPDPSASATPQSWGGFFGWFAKPKSTVEIPMQEPKSLDGIISLLTKKHGGNVHAKGIVTITSKSVALQQQAAENVAALASDSFFASAKGRDQWVCWDFREMRVRPTHYTVKAWLLKSWIVEGSLDGESWTGIDRQTENAHFKDRCNIASFAVLNPAESRFIRLTQADTTETDRLVLYAVEFFGTISE